MKKILILEDNKDINKILSTMLSNAGYKSFSTFDAFEALRVFNDNKIDCVITDLMLPIMSGEEFIQEVRKQSLVHIIVVTAKTTNFDKLEVLRIGADDYLYKPFLEEEVLIKLENLFAKNDYKRDVKLFNNNEVLFTDGIPALKIKNTEVQLTAVEYKMIKLLIENDSRVISREQFLNVIEVSGNEVFDRVVDVHIRNIRKKVKDVYDEELIKTIYGLGYSWVGVKSE